MELRHMPGKRYMIVAKSLGSIKMALTVGAEGENCNVTVSHSVTRHKPPAMQVACGVPLKVVCPAEVVAVPLGAVFGVHLEKGIKEQMIVLRK